jgi:hypothetical protein
VFDVPPLAAALPTAQERIGAHQSAKSAQGEKAAPPARRPNRRAYALAAVLILTPFCLCLGGFSTTVGVKAMKKRTGPQFVPQQIPLGGLHRAIQADIAAEQPITARDTAYRSAGPWLTVSGLSAVVVGCLLLSGIPALVAVSRRHPDWRAISIIGLFVGWTFLGCGLALGWAFKAFPPATSSEPVALDRLERRLTVVVSGLAMLAALSSLASLVLFAVCEIAIRYFLRDWFFE